MEDRSWPNLAQVPGDVWVRWFSKIADKQSELNRALDCLDVLSSPISTESAKSVQRTASAIPTNKVKACLKFIGHSKCPSSSACDKIAFRVQILNGWLDSLDVSCETHQVALKVLGGVLPKLFALCEGADDRRYVLLNSVRCITKDWLDCIEVSSLSMTERAQLTYNLAMQDQTGVVSPNWWWNTLSNVDRETLLTQVKHDIEIMEALEPSTLPRWKSLGGRWQRLRLKALLEFIGERALLSELLAKSALDDFEAAEALGLMAESNRRREAIALGEKWHRVMPENPIVGEALLKLYLHDGWDEEASSLLQTLYQFDPNPKWNTLHKHHFKRSIFQDD